MRFSTHLPRFYRLAVLIAIGWLVHAQHQWQRAQRDPALTAEQVTRFFPAATELGSRNPPYHLQSVRDPEGGKLGHVLHTSPEADYIHGYSGPSDVLLALDPSGKVIGASLLSSADTSDHVRAVIESKAFWNSFQGLTLGAPGHPEIDAVSGSTLTCGAIIRSITNRLGGVAESSLFPTEILLVEVQQTIPAATSMKAHPEWPGLNVISDASGRIIAHALRTAPSQDSLLGYQGPSDILILLDAKAGTVLGLRLRKSFDNEEYYDRILEDERYLKIYNGLSVNAVAVIDYAASGIEGVSGATITSWAIAESVKRRLGAFLAERNKPADPPFLALRDYLLLGVTLGALLMAFTRLRGVAWLRTGWQVVLVVVLGYLTGDLLSQALLAGWAQNGVAWMESLGLVFLVTAAFVIPWATGKQLYCHHLCPHGALQQWMQKLPFPTLKVTPKVDRILAALPIVLLALVLGSAMLGFGINLASLEAFDAYLFQVAGWISITIAGVGLLASAFVPLAYCKYGCPTGLLLKFIRWRGAGERFGQRDLIAGAFLIAAGAIHLVS